jgi:hypothetical protein
MSLLINDIFILICQECNSILKLKLISKSHEKIIKHNNFYGKNIYIKDSDTLDHTFSNYKFKNLTIDCKCSVNKHIKKLKKCYKLNLESSNITNYNMIKLKRCHTLNLSYTNIMNNTVMELKGCNELILEGTELSEEVINKVKKHCKVTFSEVKYEYDYNWDRYDYPYGDFHGYYDRGYYDLEDYY